MRSAAVSLVTAAVMGQLVAFYLSVRLLRRLTRPTRDGREDAAR